MTIFDSMFRHALTNPGQIAIKSKECAITYHQLLRQVNAYRRYLENGLCRRGDRVILNIKKRQDWLIVFLALLYMDCWVIPAAHDLTDHELETVKRDTQANRVISTYQQGLSAEDELPYKMFFGGILHMTSATTGKQKYCIRDIDSLSLEGEMYQKKYQLGHSDRILLLPPVYHSFALGAGPMAALAAGSCLYMAETFVPGKVIEILKEEHITRLILVPVMARLMCRCLVKTDAKQHSLKSVIAGAETITGALYTDFYKKYGMPLLGNYGSTETGAVFSQVEPEPCKSVGKPMDGVAFKILDENGRAVSGKEAGCLWVKCKSILTGYLDWRTSPFDEDGYFKMNDIVTVNQEGDLFLCGRAVFQINTGGKKVNPAEVEQTLVSMNGVEDCAVMEYQGKVKAYVVAQGITAAKIRKECKVHLSGYKIPALIEFVGYIPRNQMGKIQYAKLRNGEGHVI